MFKRVSPTNLQRCQARPRSAQLHFERLEPRFVLNAGPVISELMASNNGGLADEDGDFSDWFEVYNPTTAAIDLNGWYATDDATDKTKWQFPNEIIEPGEYLIVFASDKNRALAGSELHTNYKLASGGEYLALIESDGVAIAHEYSPGFPTQQTDVSYGLSMEGPSTILVDEGAAARVHIPSNGDLGLFWTSPVFNDASWPLGVTGVGYEDAPPGYDPLLGATVPSGTTSAYIRIAFNVADASVVSSLILRMKYDDGFQAYLNGVELDAASANSPATLAWNSTATSGHNDSAAIEFEDFDVSAQRDLLVDGPNVLAIHGLNTSSGSTDMLITPQLVAHETALVQPLQEGFFTTPTPGEANATAFAGFVADTEFSIDRGLFDAPFSLDITTPTPGAMIVYTLDGTEPSLTNGIQVLPPNPTTAPTAVLNVNGSSDGVATVRATAFKDGLAPTKVDTQTYVFPQGVVSGQTESAGTPAGFPADGAVNGHAMDYGFAADIANHPSWGPQLIPALQGLPTLSLVTDADNLFDPSTGIYVNQGGSGRAWERPASLELIHPDGSPGFQVEMGMRIRGNFSLSDGNPKHAFRLFFREEYGDDKLRFPVFGGEGVDAFDKLDLRTWQNDSWAWQNSDQLTMIHDVFSRDTQRDMGQAYTRSRYYHLYINGQYWGIYQFQERSEAAFGASYFGGDRDEYDTIKAAGGSQGYITEATDGDMFGAWRDLWNLVNQIETETDPVANYALFMRAQGLNPDGARNLAYPVLLDVDNLIDYMNVIFYTSDEDAPLSRPLSNNRSNNWFAVRNRTGDEGFRFFAHDAEQTMISKHNVEGLAGDRTGPFNNSNKDDFTYSNPQWLHEDLMEGSAEYRMRFADRVQRHFFNEGALTVGSVTARFDARAAELDAAVVAQSARWGNGAGQNPSFSKNTWSAALENIRNNFFNASPQTRGDIVLGQLRNDGLYPDVPFVILSQHGGQVLPGFQLQLSAPQGAAFNGDFDGDLDVDADDFALMTDPRVWLRPTQPGGTGDMNSDGFVDLDDFNLFKNVFNASSPGIYYTLDGATDPRAVGGGLNTDPAVVEYDGGAITISAPTVIKARAFSGGQWSALTEAVFSVDPAADANNLRITELNYHPGDPTASELALDPTLVDNDFEFIEFQNVGPETIDLSGVELTMVPRGNENEGVDFAFTSAAVTTLDPGEFVLVVENQAAFDIRYGASLPVAGQWNGSLSNGGERVTVLDVLGSTIHRFDYDDENGWPTLPDGGGPTLEVIDTAGDYNSPSNWQASGAVHGTPGAEAAPVAAAVVVGPEANRDEPSAATTESHGWLAFSRHSPRDLRTAGIIDKVLAEWSSERDRPSALEAFASRRGSPRGDLAARLVSRSRTRLIGKMFESLADAQSMAGDLKALANARASFALAVDVALAR